jgi:hypothetical protein
MGSLCSDLQGGRLLYSVWCAAKHTVWIEKVMQVAPMPQRDDSTVILAALGHATSVYNL